MDEKIIGIDPRHHQLAGWRYMRVAIRRHPQRRSGASQTRRGPFTKNGERIVGQVAREQAVTNPRNTVFSIKAFRPSGRSEGWGWGSGKRTKRVGALQGGVRGERTASHRFGSQGKRYTPTEIPR